MVTIIPEATDEDLWNDTDSLTEGGRVYDHHNSRGRKQPPSSSHQKKVLRLSTTAADVPGAPASLTPSTVGSTVLTADAPASAASSASLVSSPDDADGVKSKEHRYDDSTNSYDEESDDDDPLGGDTPRAGGAGATPGSTLSSFTPYSLTSPGNSSTNNTNTITSNTVLLREYEDDDSTAMVIEEEEDPTAPSDEEGEDNEIDPNDPGEPGRLVPSTTTPNHSQQPLLLRHSNRGRLSRLLGAASSSAPRLFKRSSSTSSTSSKDKKTTQDPTMAADGAAAVSSTSSSRDNNNSSANHQPRLTGASIVPSVDPHTLSHFHRLELQAKLAQQSYHKQAKARKYRDRQQDVQGYKQLWREYEQLQLWEREQQQQQQQQQQQEQLQGDGPSNQPDRDEDTTVPKAVEVVENFASPTAAGKDDGTGPSGRSVPSTEPLPRRARFLRRGGGNSRGRRSASAGGDGRRSRAQSFDLADSTNWYFDFQAVDFAYEGIPHDRLQSSLSLLSEASLDAQRRLYAEKRRQRRRTKRHNKKKKKNQSKAGSTHQASSSSVASSRASNPSWTVADEAPLATDAESFLQATTMTPRRDYGPVRGSGSVQSAPLPLTARVYSSDLCPASAGAVAAATTPAEWVDQEIHCDASSCLSDMGETASYTSNDYRVPRRSARHYFSSSYGSGLGSGMAGGTSTTDKLAELEAKVQALQERNAELAAAAAASSSQGSNASPRTDPDGSSSSPTGSGRPFSAETAKTPVATNGIASIRRRFEDTQDIVRALDKAPEESAMPYTCQPPAPTQSPLMAYHLGRVIADESSETEPDDSILSAIEESMTSFASSTADKVPSPFGKASPPFKSLLSEVALSVPPLDLHCPSGDEELFLLASPDESIDAPPLDESLAVPSPDAFACESATSSPLKTPSSEAPPSLRALNTSSTETASDDDDFADEGEEKKDHAGDELQTPVKAADPAKATETPVQEMESSSHASSPGSNEGEDIFDRLARGELDATADENDDVLNGTAKPVDPPGKALLNGTPSLEVKRRPSKSKPKASGADPVAPIGWSPSSNPTPIRSPSRQSSISPNKNRSPRKNRWIAGLSTSEFLAMSEENALERLSRLEHREIQRTKLSLYDSADEDAESDEERAMVDAAATIAIVGTPANPSPQPRANEELPEDEATGSFSVAPVTSSSAAPIEELAGTSERDVALADSSLHGESLQLSDPEVATIVANSVSLNTETLPASISMATLPDRTYMKSPSGLLCVRLDRDATDGEAVSIPTADAASETVGAANELLLEESATSEVVSEDIGDNAPTSIGEDTFMPHLSELTDEVTSAQTAGSETAVGQVINVQGIEVNQLACDSPSPAPAPGQVSPNSHPIPKQVERLANTQGSQGQVAFSEHPRDEGAVNAASPASTAPRCDDAPALREVDDPSPVPTPSLSLAGAEGIAALREDGAFLVVEPADPNFETASPEAGDAPFSSFASGQLADDDVSLQDELCASFELAPLCESGAGSPNEKDGGHGTTESVDIGLFGAPIAEVCDVKEKPATSGT